MKDLSNFISEKLHISNYKKSDKDEEFYEKTSTDLLHETQNEIHKSGEYHTYDYQDGIKKYRKGFFYFNRDDEFIGIQAFNSAKDFSNDCGLDPKYYSKLESISIGDSEEFDGTKYTRIW